MHRPVRFTLYPTVNKTAVRDQILLRLREEFVLQTRAALLSRDEAISEESRPENQYDMHSQEAAYLAEGQARLAAEIAESIKRYESLTLADCRPSDPTSIGALVAVEQGEKKKWYFIGPRGGGLDVQVDGADVLVLTPQSPLGRALMGKRQGDSVKLPGATNGQVSRISAVT